jgi:hypothetical protein
MYPPSIDMKQSLRDVYEVIESPSTTDTWMTGMKSQQACRMANLGFTSLEHIAQHIDYLAALTQENQRYSAIMHEVLKHSPQ